MSKTKALATKQDGNIEQASKMNDMFGGGSVQLPVDAALPVISILRESAQFEMPDGRYEKEFTGHVLHWHNVNQYYRGTAERMISLSKAGKEKLFELCPQSGRPESLNRTDMTSLGGEGSIYLCVYIKKTYNSIFANSQLNFKCINSG